MAAPRRRKSSSMASSFRRKSRPVSMALNRAARHIMSAKPSLRRSSLALHRINSGKHQRCHDGFDELRMFVKQGGEFSKELVQTLSERADLESSYAKGLAKLSSRLIKAVKNQQGTVSNAWHFIADDMEASAETHQSISHRLQEGLVRPLKMLVDAQHRARKRVEAVVDKRAKALSEWRAAESKTKTKSYGTCREHERVMDAVLDCKLGRGRVLAEKELLKLEAKRKRSETTVRKTDLDYYAYCLKAERARLEWESAVLRGCASFRQMEEERLVQLQGLAEQYYQTMVELRPKLVTASERLHEPVKTCDISADMEVVGKKANIDSDSLGEQVLPSFYSEDATNAMNLERRRESLARMLNVVKSDISREKKGKAGVENLAKALKETPKFGGQDSQQDVQEKIQHMRSMLTYLEACRYKVLGSLLSTEGRTREEDDQHPLRSCIETTKDKSGMPRAVLRVSYMNRQQSIGSLSDDHSSTSSSAVPLLDRRGRADGLAETEAGRGAADGEDGDSSDFDDFSDGDEQVNIIEVVNGENTRYVQSRCHAIYDYDACLDDELSIRVGDVIEVHEKQDDGWWMGRMKSNGQVGIFPATYVQEIDAEEPKEHQQT